MNNVIFGSKGEQIALKHLEDKGYKILEKNWRYSHLEIDIIARTENEIVFVEVKTRNTAYFGFPEAAVNRKKQQFLANAANAYINSRNIDLENRFDIISIIMNQNTFELEHIEDAFYPNWM